MDKIPEAQLLYVRPVFLALEPTFLECEVHLHQAIPGRFTITSIVRGELKEPFSAGVDPIIEVPNGEVDALCKEVTLRVRKAYGLDLVLPHLAKNCDLKSLINSIARSEWRESAATFEQAVGPYVEQIDQEQLPFGPRTWFLKNADSLAGVGPRMLHHAIRLGIKNLLQSSLEAKRIRLEGKVAGSGLGIPSVNNNTIGANRDAASKAAQGFANALFEAEGMLASCD